MEWGVKILNEPIIRTTLITQTPWSTVLKIETPHSIVYLKQTPSDLFIEAEIIKLCRDVCKITHIPEVIATNKNLHCFLTKDAGNPLREILKQQFDENLFCKAVCEFNAMQLIAADYVDMFLDIGVPDWRLEKLPELYSQLLLEKDILMADGLTEREISQLEGFSQKISTLCKKLSEYPIKQTIIQPDFNDNNILIDSRRTNFTIIDLGEIVISHPFFSLVNCLQQIKKHHALTEDNDTYQRIKDAYLKNYLIESPQHLTQVFEQVQLLWPVYWSLANHRLMRACGIEKIMSFQWGRLCNSLRQILLQRR